MLQRLRRRWLVVPTWVKVTPLAALLIALSAMHRHALDVAPALLPILQELLFLPLFMASLLFGLRGGLLCALLISANFFPMIYTELAFEQMFLLGSGLQIGLYFLTGTLTGLLVDRERREARRLKQSEDLALMGQAAAVVAHELKSPLVAIGGFARRIQKDLPADHPDQEKLAIIVDQAGHMERLLMEMLDYSRPLKLNLAETSLNRVVEAALPLLSGQAEEARVEVAVDLDPTMPDMRIDSDRLRQVVLNLVQNALQASDAGDSVRLLTRSREGLAVLEVRDHGQGIPEEDREKIFLPFFTTKRRGTGLGLAIVRKIVAAHGGLLEVSSQPEQGSVFSVLLPLAGPARERESQLP
jgi:signal transduction histidine kinase